MAGAPQVTRRSLSSVTRPASLLLLALLILFFPVPHTSAAPTDRHIPISASMFEYAPGTVRVNPGDRVTIELASTDVVHGLYLDGYELNLTADPGQPAQVSFTADLPGVFRFRCSVTCGSLHPFMMGKFQVGPNWILWRGVGLGVLAVVLVLSPTKSHDTCASLRSAQCR